MINHEKLGDYGIGAVVGATIAAILNLGIFATRADLEAFRADVAEKYVTKAEIKSDLDILKQDIKDILKRLD